jgi:curved DNA-binding protein CbpA
MNYYVVLGVPQDADPDTIRSAFRALARRYHPDAGEGSSAERFRQILTAYETLNDATRRGNYDRSLRNDRSPRTPVIEPLRARPAPAAESLLAPRRHVEQADPLYESIPPAHVDELLEELFQVWDDVFFDARRRRNLLNDRQFACRGDHGPF